MILNYAPRAAHSAGGLLAPDFFFYSKKKKNTSLFSLSLSYSHRSVMDCLESSTLIEPTSAGFFFLLFLSLCAVLYIKSPETTTTTV